MKNIKTHCRSYGIPIKVKYADGKEEYIYNVNEIKQIYSTPKITNVKKVGNNYTVGLKK